MIIIIRHFKNEKNYNLKVLNDYYFNYCEKKGGLIVTILACSVWLAEHNNWRQGHNCYRDVHSYVDSDSNHYFSNSFGWLLSALMLH